MSPDAWLDIHLDPCQHASVSQIRYDADVISICEILHPPPGTKTNPLRSRHKKHNYLLEGPNEHLYLFMCPESSKSRGQGWVFYSTWPLILKLGLLLFSVLVSTPIICCCPGGEIISCLDIHPFQMSCLHAQYTTERVIHVLAFESILKPWDIVDPVISCRVLVRHVSVTEEASVCPFSLDIKLKVKVPPPPLLPHRQGMKQDPIHDAGCTH